MIDQQAIRIKMAAQRILDPYADTLAYAARSAAVCIAVYFLAHPVVIGRFGTEREGLPSLLGAMDHFRILFYGLLPAVLFTLFFPRSLQKKLSPAFRFAMAFAAAVFCGYSLWHAASPLRAAVIPLYFFIGAGLYIGINIIGLLGYFPATGERTKASVFRRLIRLFPLADVILPGFVHARLSESKSRGMFVLRIFPALFLSLPLGLGLFHYLPDVDKYSAQSAGIDPVGTRQTDTWGIEADDAEKALWTSAAVAVERFAHDDNKWISTGPVFPGSGVVKIGVDRKARRLLGVAYSPDECVMKLFDADSMAVLETRRFPFKKRMELGGATVLWDEPAGILDVVYEGGIMRFSPDRRTLLQYAGCGWSSDAVLDSERRLLYVAVVFPPLLVAFDADTLRIKKQLLLPKGVSRMAFDAPTHRLFLSFPPDGVVRVVDIDQWKIVRSIPSFIGVRAMGFDKDRDLLFFGGFSPYMEIRRLQTYEFLDRVKAPVWQRMILPPQSDRGVFVASAKGVYRIPVPEEASFEYRKSYDPFFMILRALGCVVHWKINEPRRDFLPEEILPETINQSALP